jgi:hypothetical protein
MSAACGGTSRSGRCFIMQSRPEEVAPMTPEKAGDSAAILLVIALVAFMIIAFLPAIAPSA